MRAPNTIIFTDLDGTLLDHDSYSWAPAQEALDELARRRIPLVFVTSKTRAEIDPLRRKLGHGHPFVTENGGGVFIPLSYFQKKIANAVPAGHQHICIPLARPYAEITTALDEIAEETGASVVGFHHMSPREVAQNTHLTLREAELAKQREFDEPFFFAGGEEEKRRFVESAERRGLTITRGDRFWHLFAGSDKGRALQLLMQLYREALRGATRVRSIALGDSPNDLPMLQAANVAVLVAKPSGDCDDEVLARMPKIIRAPAPGPAGWNAVMLDLLGK